MYISRVRDRESERARPTHTHREDVCGASSVLEVDICIYQERETERQRERARCVVSVLQVSSVLEVDICIY